MSTDADEELAERARKLFSGPIEFLKSAPGLKFLPDADAPEIAFAGRSNVGKSSLLNALTNRKGLARTSNTPGRTQELNFFEVGQPLQFRLVDMLRNHRGEGSAGRRPRPGLPHLRALPETRLLHCASGAGTTRRRA